MEELILKDLRHIWHPYTQMKDLEEEPPVLITHAEGVKLYDASGNFYYDTISSWWCNVHGHNHPRIKEAIKRQLDELEHVLLAGFTHKPAVLLAEKLVSITPENLVRVFYSDNGSTSVEAALKMSFQYWRNTGRSRKTKFVHPRNSYHGDTIGAMSVGGIELYREIFSPLLFPTFEIPSPYCYRCPAGKERGKCDIDCLKPLEELLRERSEEIAAFILEPLVQASGGMIIYPAEYVRRAAEICRRYEVHLILDEVATGFGRTGRMFACEIAEVKPDFLCLSKGITSGYLPFAATLTTEEIFRAFYADYAERKTFFHGHTYTGNPLGAAAALASLEVFEEERVLERAGELIPLFHKRLEEFGKLGIVGDVRCIGLIGALELVRDKSTKEPFPFEERAGWRVYRKGLRRNLILRPLGDVIYFFLPLCIKREELEDIMERAFAVLSEVERELC